MREFEKDLCRLFFSWSDNVGTTKKNRHDVVRYGEGFSSWGLYDTEIAFFSRSTHELTLYLPDHAKTRTTQSRMNAILEYGNSPYRVRVSAGIWALVDPADTRTCNILRFPDDASRIRGLKVEL